MHLNQVLPLPNSAMLVAAFVAAALSIVWCHRGRHRSSVIALFIAAFCVRFFMAHLDPFLHQWDERFHALVAKNMMSHPFKPMLRWDELFVYDYKVWCSNHVWLHKQPLFLWQMALSMKMFGVNVYAIRYPAALMGSIGVLMLYRIAFLLTTKRWIALTSALLFCFNYYHLEQVSGLIGMDQNDIAFGFYILASLWAFTEYVQRNTPAWAVLAGIFVGCAVLNKWLSGLVVYSGWLLWIISERKDRSPKPMTGHLIVSIMVSIIVFLPWQLYILHTFPAEAAYEFEYNSRHVSEVIEGHKGDSSFYIQSFNIFFGEWVYWLVPVGVFLFASRKYAGRLTAPFVLYYFVWLAFFSFIAQTKITAYFMPMVPIGCIFISTALYQAFEGNRLVMRIFPIAVSGAILLTFNLPQITLTHDPENKYAVDYTDWTGNKNNATALANVKNNLPKNVSVVLNTPEPLDFMFYNDGCAAFDAFLSPDSLKKLMDKHIPIAVLTWPLSPPIPKALTEYDSAYFVYCNLH